MSYDFHLVSRRLGPDLAAAARAQLEDDGDEFDPGPPDPEKQAGTQRLVRALTALNPQLTPFAFDHAAIAAERGITEAEARTRYRHIELNGPEDGHGIQIVLGDDGVDVAVPYWHQRPEAAAVFDEIWGYLQALERDGGFAVYDPQLDRILNLAADRPAVLDCYARVMAEMSRADTRDAPSARPWWKLW
jgi:hypothetical protein